MYFVIELIHDEDRGDEKIVTRQCESEQEALRQVALAVELNGMTRVFLAKEIPFTVTAGVHLHEEQVGD